MKNSAKRANFIQKYRQKLQRELDTMGYPHGKQEEPVGELVDEDPPAMFDAWDHVHAGSECWNCHDPSSTARRVSLIR